MSPDGDDAVDPVDPVDPVEAYLAAYVAAVERGDEPPSLDDAGLDGDARAEAAELLALLAGQPAGPADLAGFADAAGVPRDPDTPPTRARPRAESGFALAHRFVRPAPDVVVVGDAVARGRQAAGLTVGDVAVAMAQRGSPVDVASLEELEGSAGRRLPPREARLLAAVLDLPLAAIEATAEPWPADPTGREALRRAGADAVVLGDDVVVRTVRGDHLGVLACPGDAGLLDSRTYRQCAAALLTGPWSYLAGALLVAVEPPHLALAVDALDCVTRWHAPTGLTGFSRLSEPEPIADALASYDHTYAVHWTDPVLLAGPTSPADPAPAGARTGAGARAGEPEQPGTAGTAGAAGAMGSTAGPAPAAGLASHLPGIVERLGDEARRSRQPGKRPGYEAAARWLAAIAPGEVATLVDDLAARPAEDARAWLAEQLGDRGQLGEEVGAP